MKTNRICLLPLILVMGCTGIAGRNPKPKPMDWVDPRIGTGASTTVSAAKHGQGTEVFPQTIPAAGLPFGMTQWTPQTRSAEKKCVAPFYAADARIQGFRGTHWLSGSCVQDYGSVTLMPLSGRTSFDPEKRASAYRTDRWVSTPAAGSVHLEDSGVDVDMTAAVRTGFLRFAFTRNDSAFVLVEPNSDEGQGTVRVDPGRREIAGENPVHRIYQGWGKPAGFSGCFVARFDRPFDAFGTYRSGAVQDDAVSGKEAPGLGAFAVFKVRPGDRIRVKIGTSFSSIDQARRNLDAEIPHWNFERTRREAEAEWNRALSAVEVRGPDDAMKTVFCTALFHAMQQPRTFSDADGTYPGFADDSTLHRADGFVYYDDFPFWDTFRALHPLLTLAAPGKNRDMARSVLRKAEQGGWLPIFPCWNHYTAAMIGDHAIAFIGDAAAKGIGGLELEKAYRFMRQNAFDAPVDPKEYEDGKGRRALGSYLRYGYVPLEDPVNEAFHKREQVSRTLEYAFDDFVLSRVAGALGNTTDERILRERAGWYRNVFDTAAGWARGRHADGSWVRAFDPYDNRTPWITEGTPAQYTWFVPQDVAGLVRLMGGPGKAAAKLDAFFEEGKYWHGNEPGHHIAFLYDWMGVPYKTQETVRRILREEYGLGPGGLSGNDDSGQMSAWAVFAAMGFYPVCPGVPEYAIASPAFEEVRLRMANGRTFTLRARKASPGNVYIQSARLDGKPYTRTFIRHEDMQAGKTIEFEMGDAPNPTWGSAPGDAPFSLSRGRADNN